MNGVLNFLILLYFLNNVHSTNPTINPTIRPTRFPTQLPTISPTYIANHPTPIPTVGIFFSIL